MSISRTSASPTHGGAPLALEDKEIASVKLDQLFDPKKPVIKIFAAEDLAPAETV